MAVRGTSESRLIGTVWQGSGATGGMEGGHWGQLGGSDASIRPWNSRCKLQEATPFVATPCRGPAIDNDVTLKAETPAKHQGPVTRYELSGTTFPRSATLAPARLAHRLRLPFSFLLLPAFFFD